MKIAILHAEKGVGKTTWLMKQCNTWSSVGGILSPDKDSKRMFYNIQEQIYYNFEIDGNSKEDYYKIGKYRFSIQSFELANAIMKSSIDSNSLTIIDEYGPLEMKGLGFANMINPLLESNKYIPDKYLLIVLRNSLLNEFQDKFNHIKSFISFSEMKDIAQVHWEYLFH